ncbi:uncharacterized protein LOC122385931 [Amphibalanus amphitrite]|uniref:uncharacterized protein LOC122385931 n=1 Tax=Amphibalanus amphitrite TaxID=1232801 RepID=UPI001C90A860|nr:uncharacterized protein LOC122385931 [Amphibalanus amphitrite]
MSSIDVHTQYTIQRDVSEAYAIVCATEKGKTGYFHLTVQGMRNVSGCQTGGFHEGCGEDTNWEAIEQPEWCSTQIEVTDLRSRMNKKVQVDAQEGPQQNEDAGLEAGRACSKNNSKKRRPEENVNKDSMREVGKHKEENRRQQAALSNAMQQSEDKREKGEGGNTEKLRPSTSQGCERSQGVQNLVIDEELQEEGRSQEQISVGRNHESRVEEMAQQHGGREQEGDEAEKRSEACQQETVRYTHLVQDEGMLCQESEKHEGETSNREENSRNERENVNVTVPGKGGQKDPTGKPKGLRKARLTNGVLKSPRIGLAAQIQQLKAENQKLRVQLHQLEQGKEVQKNADQVDGGKVLGEGLCGACAAYLLWLHRQEEEKCGTLQNQSMDAANQLRNVSKQGKENSTPTANQRYRQGQEQGMSGNTYQQEETENEIVVVSSDNEDTQKVRESSNSKRNQELTKDKTVQCDLNSQSTGKSRSKVGNENEGWGEREQQRKEMNCRKGGIEKRGEDNKQENHEDNTIHGRNPLMSNNAEQGRNNGATGHERGQGGRHPRYYRTRVFVNQRYRNRDEYREYEEREWEPVHHFSGEDNMRRLNGNSRKNYYRTDRYREGVYKQEQREGGKGARAFGKQDLNADGHDKRNGNRVQVEPPYYGRRFDGHPGQRKWGRHEHHEPQDWQLRGQRQMNWNGNKGCNQSHERETGNENQECSRDYMEDERNYGTTEEWNEEGGASGNQQQRRQYQQEKWHSREEQSWNYPESRRVRREHGNFHRQGASGNPDQCPGWRGKSYAEALLEERRVLWH